MKTKLKSILMAALCAVGLAAFAAEPVEYLDWDDVEKKMTNATCDVYEVVTNGMATFEAGKTYVVKGEIVRALLPETEEAAITVNGTKDAPTYLILCDEARMAVTSGDYCAGIAVPEGKSLVICGQQGGTGKLEVLAGICGAGIGGCNSQNGGIVTINGGIVTASAFYDAEVEEGAAIGGGAYGCGGEVTINGGSVTVTGGLGAAGIGGGAYASGDTVTINGGTVVATGSFQGAGIGGGRSPVAYGDTYDGGTVTINGGTVTATGGDYGAGIGGGFGSNGATVTIDGGSVTATGGAFYEEYGNRSWCYAGAGIGGGANGDGGAVTIRGGTVTAIGGECISNGVDRVAFAAGIGGGVYEDGADGTVTFNGGFVVVTGETAEVTAPIAQEDYEADHSARYAHIAPPKPEISAVSAEGFLDLTVGDRVAADAEPIVADPKWGNGKKAFVKIDGEDPAREYPELSIDKWFTSALTAGRYGMKFTSGETNETAVFWKTGDDWVVQDLPPSSAEGVFFESGKTHLILGTTTFVGDAPLEVEDGAKFEYGTGAGFKGGKLEAPRRYAKVDAEGGLYQIVEKIKGCEDNPWVIGDDGEEPPKTFVEAYTNGTKLVIVGAGTITDLSEIPAGIKSVEITEATVKGAEENAFAGFNNVKVTLPDNWQGELPEKGAWYGATGVTLTAWPKTVKNVKVQQRYPWNGKVDVDFDLTGEGDVKVKLSVTVDGKKIKNPTVTGETTFELGKGKELKDCRLTWDAKADFGDAEKHEKIRVKLTVEKAEAD